MKKNLKIPKTLKKKEKKKNKNAKKKKNKKQAEEEKKRKLEIEKWWKLARDFVHLSCFFFCCKKIFNSIYTNKK